MKQYVKYCNVIKCLMIYVFDFLKRSRNMDSTLVGCHGRDTTLTTI